MKEIEKYVCTLQQAKRLAELGVEQNSLFYWNCCVEPASVLPDIVFEKNKPIYSAFTSQELGELNEITKGWFNQLRVIDTSNKHLGFSFNHFVHENNISRTVTSVNSFFTSEAQARAEFLIHLLDNKEVKND
jgi:hypothetical protein